MEWFAVGDPTFDPAQLPAAREGATYTVHNGRLWLIAGFDASYSMTNTVWSYDPTTNTWDTTHDPISVSIAPYYQAAGLGDWLYFTSGTTFYRYNVTTGATETLATASYDQHPLVALGGLIYHGLSTATPRVYDPGADSWADAPGTSPYEANLQRSAVAVDGDSIVIAGGYGIESSALAYRYTPGTASWDALPALPTARNGHALVNLAGSIISIGGIDLSLLELASVVELGESSWGALDPLPGARSYHAAGVVETPEGLAIVVAGGYGGAATSWEPTSTVFAYGFQEVEIPEGLDELNLTASIIPPYPTDALLPLTADLEGGPGVTATLLLSAVMGRERRADLLLTAALTSPSTRAVPTL